MLTPDFIRFIDHDHIWHPYASICNPPPVNVAVSALGNKVTLSDGKVLIDALSSWWCVAHGHNHPAIVEAIRKQSEKMCQVMFAGFTHEPAAALADALMRVMPAGLDRYFFADSGSISVECAAKMAVQYHYSLGHPERCHLVALKGGYHGDTTGAMALSDPDGMHVLFQGLMAKHFFAEQPTCRLDGDWDDHDLDSMRAILAEHGDTIAAVIMEPVFQGGNAMWLYHPNYLKGLRKLCDQYGILLIADEIATGLGRTGTLFAVDKAGITPDIMTIGKILTGGTLSLAVAATTGHVAEVISSCGSGAFMHGPTFMGNPLACAAAVASLKLVEGGYWKAETARIQRALGTCLEAARNHPNVTDIRHVGAIGVLELRHMPDPQQVATACLESGVWLRPFGNWVYTMPPFVTTDDEIDRIVSAMIKLADIGWGNRNRPVLPPTDPIMDIHE